MSAAELEDVVSYWMDVCQSLWAFLQCYPAGAVDLAVEDFPVRLAGVYEALAGAFAAAFASRTDAALCARLKGVVHRAQACLLHVFQRIIHGAYIEQLAAREDKGQSVAGDDAEKYLDALMAVVGERRFIAHHQRVYPFGAMRAALMGHVDDTRLSYANVAIDGATAAFTRGEVMAAARAIEELERHDASTVKKQDATGARGEGERLKETGGARGDGERLKETGGEYEAIDDDALGGGAALAAARPTTGVELDSLVSSIQDLMPDLGRGFIRLCLEEYDYDNERVVHALLEDRLCPALRDVDRSLPLEPDPEPVESFDAAVYQPSVLDHRRNVFDDDEFDVLSHDIDARRVHVGKRERVAPRGAAQFLNDRSGLAALRPLMERYANEDVESMYDKVDEYEDGYEDEYDDTYDSNAVGAIDADSADELTSPPPRWHQHQMEDGGARGPQDTEPGRPPRDLFIEDPAKLRQIREEKRAEAMMRRRGKGVSAAAPAAHAEGAGGEQEKGGGARAYDTKGGPKGQGQSAEVLHNRAWKEKHKSSTVHHNRKAMSDRKHRQF